MATTGSVEQEEEKIVFTLIEKYEDVIKALEEQNNNYQLQTQICSNTIRDVVNDNSHLISELKESLKNQITLFENEDERDNGEFIANLHQQLEIVIREKEHILQAWQLALKEIERLEQQYDEQEMQPDANAQKSIKNDYIKIISSLNATINHLKEEIRHHENDLHIKDIHMTELKMMIESMKEQITDKEKEISKLMQKENGLKQQIQELQENATDLQLKATESLRETLDLKENNTILQEQTKGLISKNTGLEMRERELIKQMKETLQIAEDVMLQKDEALMKVQHHKAEINRLKDALAQIVDEAGLRTKKEVDNVHKTYESKISRLEDELKSLEMQSGELKSEAERAAREKSNLELQLEKLRKEYETGELQQAYQELHNRLITTEKNTNQVLLELDSNQAKLKLMQTSHSKEVNQWEMEKQHLEEKIKWLEKECETHLDSKIQLATKVESLQTQIQQSRTEVKSIYQNVENDMSSMKNDKLLEEQKWKSKLSSVEKYYQNTCDELRNLLSEQQTLGIRWKSEMKRATQSWNKKLTDMQLQLAQYKTRNSELSNLLREQAKNKIKYQIQSFDVKENDITNKLRKTATSDDTIHRKIQNKFD